MHMNNSSLKGVALQAKQNVAWLKVADQVLKRIPPMWSLENFVAVNPFLGMSDTSFNEVSSKLNALCGAEINMPIDFYRRAYRLGHIQTADILEAIALSKQNPFNIEMVLEVLENEANKYDSKIPKLQLAVDLFSDQSDFPWDEFVKDRISGFISTYLDKGQTLWNTTDRDLPLYASWLKDARLDLAPSIRGLKKYKTDVAALPSNPSDALIFCLQAMQISEEHIENYLHTLLLRYGGWGAYIAGLDWDARLYGGNDDILFNYLSVLVAWEWLMLSSSQVSGISESMNLSLSAIHRNESASDFDLRILLQNAFDIGSQRQLKEMFAQTKSKTPIASRPKAQGVFCIDVRSEVFRRNLERISPDFETFGFAGFFGFPVRFKSLSHDHSSNQCPVLIPSGPEVHESFDNPILNKSIAQRRKVLVHSSKIWKQFKIGSVSSFSFVSSLGLWFLPKLITDSLGITRPIDTPGTFGLNKKEVAERTVDLSDIALEQRIDMAQSALTAMGLKENLARLILITGHGSSTVNNPHATGLDCGACGGNSGEANAMVAAKILNDPQVRTALVERGLSLPNDTFFLACLHDTTTDDLRFLNTRELPETHRHDFEEVQRWTQKASRSVRLERSLRMRISGAQDINNAVLKRSKDWSQVRPEWGLAGCHVFVVAPRERTKNVNFLGQSFMHSYKWQHDAGFKVLETIMTAPMVVTSWINLQYFASTVDQKNFGAGNKTLHNITSGIGVLEGAGGDLKVGLPFQSVHDGDQLQHQPLRLKVVIEAPIEAMNEIIEKHQSVRNLLDNQWIFLFAMNENGELTHRYNGQMTWSCLNQPEEKSELSHVESY